LRKRGGKRKKIVKLQKQLNLPQKGTAEWTPIQADDLLNNPKVDGYFGHHMRSVKYFPEMAGNPNNIKFLTYEQHLNVHNGNWQNMPVPDEPIYRQKIIDELQDLLDKVLGGIKK
jgi:hypothetical protein